MPELPEVYTIVQGLQMLIGRKILSVWADRPRVLNVLKKTESKKIKFIERKGKNIIFGLNNDTSLLVHPKMTGIFLINKTHPYQRMVLNFKGGDFLTFSDKRRFGSVILASRKDVVKIIDSLGQDALGIKFAEFKNALFSKKGMVKRVLMDQNTVAGVGNIYADEILWKSKIHPMRFANSLSEKEFKNIFVSMNSILKKSIKLRGVSIQDYCDVFGRKGEYQNHRLVYGREGEKCKRCAAKIQRIKISQRSAHFCPSCQKLI